MFDINVEQIRSNGDAGVEFQDSIISKAPTTLADAATVEVDFGLSNVFTLTLSQAATTITQLNVGPVQEVTFYITGAFKITDAAFVDFAVAYTASAGVDIVTYQTIDGGTTWQLMNVQPVA